MDIAPDFFSYFISLRPILINDPTLYCISAWNDYGQAKFVIDPVRIYRTDVFPGLGWMLLRTLWDAELREKWPTKWYWDEFMRLPSTRLNRSCLYPEVNRVFTFGRQGVSGGQFFDKYLQPTKLNDQYVNFSTLNLTHLYKESYDMEFFELLKSAKVSEAYRNINQTNETLILFYVNAKRIRSWQKYWGLQYDLKAGDERVAGIPRASYMRVVRFRLNGHQILFAPEILRSQLNHSAS